MKKSEFAKKAFNNSQFLESREARTLRILSEYLEPLKRLNEWKVNNTILFLGSSKTGHEEKDSPLAKYYWEAEELSYNLAKWAIKLKQKGKNFVICTGGGPGIMEAANRGANRAEGKSIGMNISLPEEQYLNPYISPELSFIFHYFFMRKFWLVYKGTLDEIFETLTLVQTNKISRDHLVILLYGEEYWRKIINFDELLKHKTIAAEDLRLFVYCSTPNEAFSILKEKLIKFL
jgi:predicted Rossmann-fold nucleotide-binding protein